MATCSLRPWGLSAPRCIQAQYSRINAVPCWSPPKRYRRMQQARPAIEDAFELQRTSCQSIHRRLPPSQAVPDKNQNEQGGIVGGGAISFSSLGIFLLWGGLVAYAFLIAPNQTPIRDSIILERIVKSGVGIQSDDAMFQVNSVFTILFYIMGIYPLIYTALLLPAGRSGNNIPAWPFVTLSYAFGAFGLLPYMALWTPPKEPPVLPPAKGELEGVHNIVVKGMESPLTAIAVMAGSVFCMYQLATAGSTAWNEYLKLFDESRFVHVTSVDFLVLTALVPFWMYNDAQLRNWEARDTVLPFLCILPVVGPALYLCLRPKSQ